jgi:hypothetical protein
MLKKIIFVILAVALVFTFGCKKKAVDNVQIDDMISVEDAAKEADAAINAGNAKATMDALAKEIDTDNE